MQERRRTQSRLIQVATSASLPSASARVHHVGACWSSTRWPPAAMAAAMRASAWSCGAEISTWIRFAAGAARPSSETRSTAHASGGRAGLHHLAARTRARPARTAAPWE